jgi:putative spermidine/putrescine transport system ATP-binding protein
MTPFLSVRGVTKRHGRRAVVEDVSLEVESGEAVVIVGPSGSGKTTLLRMIAGLDAPDEGDIWFEGRQVSRGHRVVVPPYERHLGFVFQDLALWPHMRVREHLEFVLASAGVARAERRHRIRDVLALVRITDLEERYPHQLSGGEQQRAALARALVTRPLLLVLDEPLSSLDTELRAVLRAELARVRQALTFTMLYVTHDREDAAGLADRLVTMRGGRLELESLNPR